MSRIQMPNVAGSFYPGDPETLQADIDRMLAQASNTIDAPIKALISPHAGYVYSGPVAASGFTLLRSQAAQICRVVVMAPSHRLPLTGIATSSADYFHTPLGDIPVARDALTQALRFPQVEELDSAFQGEHALEVQLPFLQTVLDDFELIPFIVGATSPQQVAEVLEALWGGDETLIVISSDLSHFLDYDSARRRDTDTTSAIESLNLKNIRDHDACGRNPLNGLLVAAQHHGLTVSTLDLRNSGDTAGSKDRVVGYGAYAFIEPTYSPEERDRMLQLAADSIRHGLQTGRAPAVEPGHFPARLREQRACFVTLDLQRQLRGCIGHLEAVQPLVLDIAENAFAAAFRDPRFVPLQARELDQLGIHISILTPAQPMQFESEADLLQQIRPGVDGLILEDQGQRGTFLPSVWESLPRAEDFWRHLKQKAGLATDHWSGSIQVSRYTTESFGSNMRA